MEDFAWVVDAVIIGLIVISAYLAMVRGLMRELLALLSWVVAFVAAFSLAPSVKPLLPTDPGFQVFLSNCEMMLLVSFVLVFGLSLIVTGAAFWMLSGPTTNSKIGLADQTLGFIYGALRGLVLVAVVYIGYQQIAQSYPEYNFVDSAFTISIVQDAANVLANLLPAGEMPGWLAERIAVMMSECPAGAR